MTFRSTTRRRGIMLYEVILAIAILAIFAVIAMRILRTTLRASAAADQLQENAARYDSAVSQLRRDVWGALTVQSPDERTIRLTLPAQPAITWKIETSGSFTRVIDQPETAPRDWADVSGGMTFQVDGPIVLLTEPKSGRAISLVSRLAAPRGKP